MNQGWWRLTTRRGLCAHPEVRTKSFRPHLEQGGICDWLEVKKLFVR
jgi:hypothetical protein